MLTFKQMVKAGDIKRADAMKIQLEDIHEEPGFNLRSEGEELEASITALADYIETGGIYPALEVRPRDEGGVWIVDGHRRHRALLKLDAEGKLPRDPKTGQAWVNIVAFHGNNAEMLARVLTSQEGKKLTAIEAATGYRRLQQFGWSITEISKAVGKTRQHVDRQLTLLVANADVQQMVNSGQVSATTAIDVVREHGDQAGSVLRKAKDTATASGKAKVTAKSLGKKTRSKVPAEAVEELVNAASAAASLLGHEQINPKDAWRILGRLNKAIEQVKPKAQ